MKLIGRSTAAHEAIGTRRWETLTDAHEDVVRVKQELIDCFCSLADPDDKNKTKDVLARGKQKLGFLTQTNDAPNQVVHTDGGYYSAMISRDDSTNVCLYVRDSMGTLVEFTTTIPKGFVLFFHGSVMHCGGSYPEGVPTGCDRIFGYMLGWGQQYAVHAATLTKEEMCAQQGLDPSLYEMTEQPISVWKRRKR
jgi:hypothetical protein